jgi:hypothetical protein
MAAIAVGGARVAAPSLASMILPTDTPGASLFQNAWHKAVCNGTMTLRQARRAELYKRKYAERGATASREARRRLLIRPYGSTCAVSPEANES